MSFLRQRWPHSSGGRYVARVHGRPRLVTPKLPAVAHATDKRSDALECVFDRDEAENFLRKGEQGADCEAEPIELAVFVEVLGDIGAIAHHVVAGQRTRIIEVAYACKADLFLFTLALEDVFVDIADIVRQ